MIQIYHNPRCGKSREAKTLLEEKGIDLEVVEYLKTPLSAEELSSLLKKLNLKAEDLLRKQEAVYKENYKGKSLSEEEWISAMLENPKLIERPIVVNGNKAVVARPAEKVDEVL